MTAREAGGATDIGPDVVGRTCSPGGGSLMFRRGIALALHFAFYNFCRVFMTPPMSPAMKADVIDRL